jgi:acyl-CoA thioesterase FadM
MATELRHRLRVRRRECDAQGVVLHQIPDDIRSALT